MKSLIFVICLMAGTPPAIASNEGIQVRVDSMHDTNYHDVMKQNQDRLDEIDKTLDKLNQTHKELKETVNKLESKVNATNQKLKILMDSYYGKSPRRF